MTYENMIQELIDCGELEENEPYEVMDYSGWPVTKDFIISEIIGVVHSETKAFITVVPGL